jgi:hypothetical protein
MALLPIALARNTCCGGLQVPGRVGRVLGRGEQEGDQPGAPQVQPPQQGATVHFHLTSGTKSPLISSLTFLLEADPDSYLGTFNCSLC